MSGKQHPQYVGGMPGGYGYRDADGKDVKVLIKPGEPVDVSAFPEGELEKLLASGLVVEQADYEAAKSAVDPSASTTEVEPDDEDSEAGQDVTDDSSSPHATHKRKKGHR